MVPKQYSLRVQGYLRPEWSEWFEGLTVTCEPVGSTTLSGWVTDQAALHGLLVRIRDLGLVLLAVNQVEPEEGAPDQNQDQQGSPR